MHREASGTYKGVFEHMGLLGHQGVSECMGASKHMGDVEMPPNIWGHQFNAPKCKTYMPLKTIRVFEHMGVLGHQGTSGNV